MPRNYLSYFNLNDDPFRLNPDTSYFYNSPEHATALLSLEYCVKEKEGFCVLTGEPGTGKTTVMRIFTEKWKDKAEIALIMTPRLSPEEFFLAILDDFKIPLKTTSKNDMLKAFRDFLLTHAANGRRVAIIVDEAQQLPDTTLEELRLLSNLETEKEKLLQIILIGQPELRNKLQSNSLRQLNQRIAVRARLKALTAAETSDYINTRLIRAGNSSLLFNAKAKELVYKLSGGIPRSINLLASRGLMSAFLDESKEVFERHVMQGAEDVMDFETPEPRSSASAGNRRLKRRGLFFRGSDGQARRGRMIALSAALLLFIGAGALYFAFGPREPVKPVVSETVPAAVAARILPAKMTGMSSAGKPVFISYSSLSKKQIRPK